MVFVNNKNSPIPKAIFVSLSLQSTEVPTKETTLNTHHSPQASAERSPSSSASDFP